VPLARVMSGVSGLPVAPLRSTPWQPAQRSKKILVAQGNDGDEGLDFHEGLPMGEMAARLAAL
jgi:hypothetical protein